MTTEKARGTGSQQLEIGEVLTKEEACKFLKCGMSTLPKLSIPIIRVGRSVKYLKRDLENFLLERREGVAHE